MKKANYSRTLYILRPEGQHLPLLYSHIETKLGHELPKIQPEELSTTGHADRHKILIFDYHHRENLLPYFNAWDAIHRHQETVVVNVEHRLKTETLLSLGNLKGLFYRNDSLATITIGLQEIQNGQNWLPRHISSQLLHYYRYILQNHNIKATISLTARELQILRCLQSGASNTQMAENLFISEYTVKSHLYQIFKKISVKNRTQAIAWAKQNLLS